MSRAIVKLALFAAIIVTALGLCPAAHAVSKYRVLHSFNGIDGSGPYGGVAVGPGGDVFGTTAGGGPCGTVFELSPQKGSQWKETILYQFAANNDGCDPWSSVTFDPAGNLYGTTVGGGTHFRGTVFELMPNAGSWAETVIYNFCSLQNCDDGGSPTDGPIMDPAGNLYGTSHAVFKLSPGSDGWHVTVLHDFTGQRNGAGAESGLIFDTSGNLYGVAEEGGDCYSCGVVFEVTPASGGGWKEIVLHRFDNNGRDGYTPGSGALLMDALGNLYGTTETGGCCGGTVFKLTQGSDGHWKETILYNFKTGASGWFPTAGVVMDKAGNLYGTTDDGGSSSCQCGVVYKLAPGSNGKWTYTVLHRFSGADGAVPAGNLTLDDKGNLYGGTVLGGSTGDGVIFELTP